MTLDRARIDLRKAFVEGMGYVALSRVKSLDTLYLHGINRMALQISEDAQHIDGLLRDKTVRDRERFRHLADKAETRKTQPEPKKKKTSSSSWQEKIDKMRETYPNAYRPWTHEQDAQLKQEFLNGLDLEGLSGLLGRHQRSILMRLQKHFGEDIGIEV